MHAGGFDLRRARAGRSPTDKHRTSVAVCWSRYAMLWRRLRSPDGANWNSSLIWKPTLNMNWSECAVGGRGFWKHVDIPVVLPHVIWLPNASAAMLPARPDLVGLRVSLNWKAKPSLPLASGCQATTENQGHSGGCVIIEAVDCQCTPGGVIRLACARDAHQSPIRFKARTGGLTFDEQTLPRQLLAHTSPRHDLGSWRRPEGVH